MAQTAVFGDHLRMISSIASGVSSHLFDAPAQGIKRSVSEANGAAQKIAEGEITPDNFTALIQAGIELKANRAVAVTADEMIGSLLNRKA
ncbi:MAG: hypothetical protein QM715_07645 [Nibricoccus sp.]